MEHWQVKPSAFLAPLQHWHTFLAALVIPLAVAGAVYFYSARPLADDISYSLLAAIICLALSAFEWVWINGLIAGLRPRLFAHLLFDRHFWLFTLVNSAFLLFFQWQTPLREYLETFGPVVRVIGEREIREPLLSLVLLQLCLAALAFWVRLRLVYWPIDIILRRELRSPVTIWRMTEGESLSIFALWLTFIASAALTVILPTYLLSLLLDESVRVYPWLFAAFYMIAVLDQAYLRTYRSISGVNRMLAGTAS